MARKTFFRERTAREIEKLHTNNAYHQRGLVDRIAGLDPSEDALIIRAMLTPGRFLAGAESVKDSNRKWLKHGEYLHIPYPETKAGADASPKIPLAFRAEVLSEIKGMKEGEIYALGLSSHPTWGDRTKRVQPFVWDLEGARLFGYAENLAGGVETKVYADAKRARTEGATVLVGVPSRTRKHPRYRFKLLHVPFVRSNENLAAVQLLKPAVIIEGDGEGRRIDGRTIHDRTLIRYTPEESQEGSNIITYYPQDVAAYLGIIKKAREGHNLTPMEMNPFALPSKVWADFYTKLNNNVLIYDPSLQSKDKLRKPHIVEKSVLLARAIRVFGHDETAYWDPVRDGKLRDYVWTPASFRS